MWKSLLLIVMALPMSAVVLIIFWAATSHWKTGVVAGAATLGTCLIGATLLMCLTKRFSLFDVFLPLIFSVIWSAILTLFSLGAEVFTAPTAIGSGFILTLCLWRVYHSNGAGRSWLIFPTLVYLYEMLPVNIPGPFDDMFAFGGDIVAAILLYTVAPVAQLRATRPDVDGPPRLEG